MKKPVLIILIIAVSLSVFSCISTIDPYGEDVTAFDLTQKAYQAANSRNYNQAILYYKAFIERFPEDVKRCTWARYEIAFCYHKMGNDTKAIELFRELVAMYEGESSVKLPVAPKVLALKVIANIESGKKNK